MTLSGLPVGDFWKVLIAESRTTAVHKSTSSESNSLADLPVREESVLPSTGSFWSSLMTPTPVLSPVPASSAQPPDSQYVATPPPVLVPCITRANSFEMAASSGLLSPHRQGSSSGLSPSKYLSSPLNPDFFTPPPASPPAPSPLPALHPIEQTAAVPLVSPADPAPADAPKDLKPPPLSYSSSFSITPQTEDERVRFEEELPSEVRHEDLHLRLEDSGQRLVLTVRWLDAAASTDRSRQVQWSLPFSAHPMYIDAYFRAHTLLIQVFKPKANGGWQRLVLSDLSFPSGSTRDRVEVVPTSSATEWRCQILPSKYAETARVYLLEGDELKFVFEHEEIDYEDGKKVVTDIACTRYIKFPDQVPAALISLVAPDTVVAIKGFSPPQVIPIFNLN